MNGDDKMNYQILTNYITFVGQSDAKINKFENQIPLDKGVSFNSYLIKDEKTLLLDTVDQIVMPAFLKSLKAALGERKLDYLVCLHVEPDHAYGISQVLNLYPETTLIVNPLTKRIFNQFNESNFDDRMLVVKDLEIIDLGDNKIQFFTAPMVHWPEVMFAYLDKEKVLFTADAFGHFNALEDQLYSNLENYLEMKDSMRWYYANIVYKYGANVQAILKKISNLEIDQIMPLHGFMHKDQEIIKKILALYQTWSTYGFEEKGLVLNYFSMYGNTEKLALKIANLLKDRNIKVLLYDLSKKDVTEALTDIAKYSHLLVMTPNYNASMSFPIRNLMEHLKLFSFQNRDVGLVINSSWGGLAEKELIEYLDNMPDMRLIAKPFNIKSSFKESDFDKLVEFIDEIENSILK